MKRHERRRWRDYFVASISRRWRQECSARWRSSVWRLCAWLLICTLGTTAIPSPPGVEGTFRHSSKGILIMLSRYRRKAMAEIRIHEGESIESALRRFKRKVMQEDIIKDVKKHSFYVKPGEKKRVKQALARKRSRKKVHRQTLEERK